MYKKIKNSSFMNLIWFMIIIAPIMLFAFYTLNFFAKDNNKILAKNENVIETNLLTTPTTNNFFNYNSDKNSFQQIESPINTHMIKYNYENIFQLNEVYTLYLISNNDNYNNMKLTIGTGNDRIELDYTTNNIYNNITINETILNYPNKYIEFRISNVYNSDMNNDYTTNYYLIMYKKNDKYLTRENFLNYIEENTNYNYIEYYYSDYTYEIYLNSLLNSIQTNGFISNTFLNLSQYFGINNIYYSIACYYIEYLLIIILLHLGFDILYIVPNICHKFMEKIGGERD